MKILFVTRTFPYPPAFGGDITYSRGIIEATSQFAVVTALAISADPESADANLKSASWVCVAQTRIFRGLSLVSRLPDIAWRNWFRTYEQALAKLLQSQDWDAIVIDHLGSAGSLSTLLRHRRRFPRTKIIYMSHEFESEVRRAKYNFYRGGPLQKVALRYDGTRVLNMERRLAESVDAITTIVAEDLSKYRALSGREVAGITIAPGYDGIPSFRRIDRRTPKRVAIIGNRTSRQKLQILQLWLECAADVLDEHGIELVVAGNITEAALRSLQKRYPHVAFTGHHESLPDLLGTCRLGVVADVVGGGFKLRILEYANAATPMLGVRGAFDGVTGLSANTHVEYETLQDLTKGVLDMIDDFDTLNALHEAAFMSCNGLYEWSDRGRLLANLVRDLV